MHCVWSASPQPHLEARLHLASVSTYQDRLQEPKEAPKMSEEDLKTVFEIIDISTSRMTAGWITVGLCWDGIMADNTQASVDVPIQTCQV